MDISLITLALATFLLCALGEVNARPLDTVNCSFLKEDTAQPRWLSHPHSRIVVNPADVPQHPVSEKAADSIPLDLAFYAGERPVRLPSFWAWKLVDETTQDNAARNIEISSSRWTAHALKTHFGDGSVDLSLQDGGYGEISTDVTADLNKTPSLTVEVPETDGAMWAVKVNAGDNAEDICLIRETSRTGRFKVNISAATGWTGNRTFKLKLFAVGGPGKSVTFSGIQFVPSYGLGTKQITWWPHKILTTAEDESSDASFEVTTAFTDACTVGQLLRIKKASSSRLMLVGQFPDGTVEWDDAKQLLTLRHERFTSALKLNRHARLTSDTSAGVWALELGEAKTGDEIVASAFIVSGQYLPEGNIERLAREANPQAFWGILGQMQMHLDNFLARVPQPMNFNLHSLKRPEATAEKIQRSYYRAWVFLLYDTLPPMPENGYNYPQVACGKPSLWDEGHPKARPSCQWESFIAMQFLAEIEPDATWDAFEGMMSLVDAEGTLGGEGLPSRHVQTAWILYQATKDKNRLKAVYAPLKRMLLWKAKDPRWIFKGERPENQWDSEFVVHALLDMLYAQRICKALDTPDEVEFWQEQIDKLKDNYRKWFWKERGGTTYWLYQADKDERLEPDHSWCLQGLALPPGILEEPEKESLLKLLKSHFKDDIPFLIKGLNKHPTCNLAMRGTWQYGAPNEVARMAEAVMSAIAMADEYGECYTDWFPVKTWGVAPSVFGAANAIDTTLWHNGVMMGDGYPTIVRLPDAAGVKGLRLHGKTLNVTFKQDDIVELTGNALKLLQLPEGFIATKLPDGTPCWSGKLAKGKQLVLEDAVSQ